MEDDDIDAVIFRVDSGGGSALASDLIWRATQRLKSRKPIVVSMSDVAGSGGYYISCGASAVVAQPATITGSIGILTIEPSMGRLLKKIGVGYEALGRGEFADHVGREDQARMTEAPRAGSVTVLRRHGHEPAALAVLPVLHEKTSAVVDDDGGTAGLGHSG
jgi:ClpP class serine protease